MLGKVCDYKNQHGVQCGLPAKHFGSHELNEQLVMPDPFCLQPWDKLTLATMRAWIAAATAHGVNRDKIQKAEERFHEIERWQKAHGTRLPG